jgi:hypothetical protein
MIKNEVSVHSPFLTTTVMTVLKQISSATKRNATNGIAFGGVAAMMKMLSTRAKMITILATATTLVQICTT